MIYEIENLSNITYDIDKFGGKAVMLSKLMNNGLCVPSGFVISSSVYQLYCDNNLINRDFTETINQWLDRIGIETECIVRSSANVENIANIDCPGIFNSFICSERKNVVEFITKVWDSANSPIAKAFLSRTPNKDIDVKMAVIVQCVKRGKYSAVIQTYDFIESKNRIIVEYCYGALNSIVDDEQNASLCYIEYQKNTLDDIGLPIKKISDDCLKIEAIVGRAEIEAQITDDDIWYIQARNIN